MSRNVADICAFIPGGKCREDCRDIRAQGKSCLGLYKRITFVTMGTVGSDAWQKLQAH